MKKTILFTVLLFISLKVFSADTLYFVSGEVYAVTEHIEDYKKRPVLFNYHTATKSIDTLFYLGLPDRFLNLNFIGLYNTWGYLIVHGFCYMGKHIGEGNVMTLLRVINLRTMHKDSILIEGGASNSNLIVFHPDSIYYSVRPWKNPTQDKGYDENMEIRNVNPKDYNYVYIQGDVGTPINDSEYLILYNEVTNNNALHISKGYGLKVGPFLELQPPKEMYNAHPPALKSILVNDSHCMIIGYDYSKPNGNTIGVRHVLIYDKSTNEWYKYALKGNTPSIRSYDNGWVAGTIRDMDKGNYFDKTTMRYGDEYDFKREIPGYAEREPVFYERTDGVWGDCFDERAQNFGIYYPGLLYLFNVHTKDYIEWDTKQGDSEVLLVQDSTVYYRVNTKILKSAIVNNKALGEAELLIDDVRVRDIHWAYLKKQ
jgi:hypothetical protein